MNIEISFTGSRSGMSPIQKTQLRDLLLMHQAQFHVKFHHGDCVGADAEAHQIARELNIPVIIHPPDNVRHRAFCDGAIFHHLPEPYLVRNHYMVDVCQLLVAAPFGPERLRSGTWATVRYARRIDRPLALLDFEGRK